MIRGHLQRPVGALLVAAAAALSASAQSDATYPAVVERYARGERAFAVAGLARFSHDDLIHEYGELRASLLAAERCPAATEEGRAKCSAALERRRALVRAAVMLHADKDGEDRPPTAGSEQPRRCPGIQAALAGRYAALLARGAGSWDFARRFFLGMVLRCQWDFCLEHAQRWAHDGLKLFPKDAALLLGLASVLEESATLAEIKTAEGLAGLPQRRRDEVQRSVAARTQRFQEARSYFEQALLADPSSALARVRLGRVLWRLGQNEAARVTLEQAVRQEPAGDVLYLARLFLGRVHEDLGHLDQAAAEYRLALALDPQAQAAAVALSHVVRSIGEVEDSRELLSRALSHARRRQGRDAYWEYLTRNALHYEALFDALRRETLQ